MSIGSTIVLKGTDKFISYLKNKKREIKKSQLDALKKSGFLVENKVKTSMVGGGRPHVPSDPGQPPHRKFGKLAASITTDIIDDTRGLQVLVGIRKGSEPDKSNYGEILELTTNSKLKRPFLRPAFESSRGQIIDIFRSEISHILK